MWDEDLRLEAETEASLRAIAACLRRALEDVEAALGPGATPLAKVDRAAAALEELGDNLESVVDWVPESRGL